MNEDVKKKWVKALRSGEYKQGQFQLRPSTENFCCLGVLCDLAEKEGIGSWRSFKEADAYAFYAGGNGSNEDSWRLDRLPTQVCLWANIDEIGSLPIPIHLKGGDCFTLAKANDSYKLNFDEIADIIEREL